MLLCLGRINVGGRQRRAPADTRDGVAPPLSARREPPPKHNGNLSKRCHTLINVSSTAERHKHAGGGSAHKCGEASLPEKGFLVFKERGFDGDTVRRPTACGISLRSARSLRDSGPDQSFAVTDGLTHAAVSRGPTGSAAPFLLKVPDAVTYFLSHRQLLLWTEESG